MSGLIRSSCQWFPRPGGQGPERRRRGSLRRCPARGARVGGDPATRLAGGGRGGSRGGPGRRHRSGLPAGGPGRGGAAGAGDRLPRRRARAGSALRRRGPVPRLWHVDGARQQGPAPAAAAPGVRLRLGDHGGVLAGVNIGPNLTYTGSLATLLWRRVLHERGSGPSLGEFTRLGLLTVPAAIVLAVLALWGSLRVIGG